jgi:prophage maintenance system killer protein
MGRHTTNLTGVIYRDSITNGKADKVYYIRYKDKNNKTIELKIGKYSEGIREAYCNQKRNEILTLQRNGEKPPIITQRKKRTILSIENIANHYFNDKPTINKIVKSYYKNHILPFFKDYDFEDISREDISKFTSTLKLKKVIRTNKPLASKTMNDILNILKAITKYGLKNDLLKNDFTKYINLFDVDNTRERFLTKEEIQTLYEKTREDDFLFWDKDKSFDVYEIASRLHHRAVQIHPFQNGNGRWSRMLANIYLRQKGLMPVKWQEDLLASENPKRSEYIQALKKADDRDYTDLIEMHKITY